MSHVACGEACINPDLFNVGDLDYTATVMAVASISDDLEIVRNKKTFRWVGRWYNDFHQDTALYKHGIPVEDYGKCEHVIRFKRTAEQQLRYDKSNTEPAENGLVRSPASGMLMPAFDFYSPRGEELKNLIGGAACTTLVHKIVEAKTKLKTLLLPGNRVLSSETLPNGSLCIKIATPVKHRI